MIDALSTFARNLTKPAASADLLHELTDHVTDVLDLCGSGVTLLEDGGLRFVTASAGLVADLERVQERHQRGPSVAAVRTGQVVSISDLSHTPHAAEWPEYVERAYQVGVRAVVAIGMLAESGPMGAVNLYSLRPREWSPADLRAALLFTDVATTHLVYARALEEQRRAGELLQEALASRIVIEQAKGILAATNRVSVGEAFGLLRKHARDRNVRLRDVATAVVELGLRLEAPVAGKPSPPREEPVRDA